MNVQISQIVLLFELSNEKRPSAKVKINSPVLDFIFGVIMAALITGRALVPRLVPCSNTIIETK